MKNICEAKLAFMSMACERVDGFVIDDANKLLIGNLFDYFYGLDSTLDRRKGLWLMGGVGTGKTTLMRLFAEFVRARDGGFKLHVCSQVANDYSTTGNLDLYTYNRCGFSGHSVPMCFDDLGREPSVSNFFGQRLNVMQHILHVRYSLWQTEGLRTFVTTNCNPDDLQSIYGLFIRDRVREMFNVIVLDGESRRRA